jgi:hypothetical protein
MLDWLKKMLKVDALTSQIAALEVRKAEVLLDIAKLAAQYEERNALFSEWQKIHQEHKDMISALLAAIQPPKGK